MWEVIKKFGRKWYAWLTKRIYGSHEEATPEKHPEVTKNADYLRYDHDFLAGAYCYWAGKKTYDFFEDFLDKTEGAREVVGKTREEPYTLEHHFKLLKNYKKEFFDAFVEESVRLRKEDVKKLRSYNPDVKFAGYGPFAIYAAHLRSYSLLEYHAFPTNKDLFELFFSGFCQFEDYPASCAYQTYRGPFGVGTMLAKIPSLVFYPEQYKSAIGGCIDGHVKFANPPLGKYDMPLWFNTTLTRDYVYNAAVKTKDGYRFWDTYGFMHGDHHEEQDDAFIKDWKYILRHKPRSKPRSPIFFAEFPKEESLVDSEFATEENWRVFYNRSEEGIAHLYETSRLFGLPMGAFASWDALDTLTENDTDLIILPSIVGLSDIRLEKLRKLYKNGVSLFAVSRVDGLEDLFGVEYSPGEAGLCSIAADGVTEDIYPYTEILNYKPRGADVRMSASGNPVYFTYGRTALLNLPAYSVGRIHFKEHPYLGRATNSPLYFEITAKILKELSSPLATSDKECGITLVRDESGNDILLAIDYSRYDQTELDLEREYTVTLNADYRDCVALDGKPIRKLISESGRLDGIVVSLRQHESALIKLTR